MGKKKEMLARSGKLLVEIEDYQKRARVEHLFVASLTLKLAHLVVDFIREYYSKKTGD